MLTFHPVEDVLVLVRAPRDALDDERPTLPDLLWMPVSDQQGVLEALRPVGGQVGAHNFSVLEVKQPPAHASVDEIAKPIHQPLSSAVGDVELVCQSIVRSALACFGKRHDEQVVQSHRNGATARCVGALSSCWELLLHLVNAFRCRTCPQHSRGSRWPKGATHTEKPDERNANKLAKEGGRRPQAPAA